MKKQNLNQQIQQLHAQQIQLDIICSQKKQKNNFQNEGNEEREYKTLIKNSSNKYNQEIFVLLTSGIFINILNYLDIIK